MLTLTLIVLNSTRLSRPTKLGVKIGSAETQAY